MAAILGMTQPSFADITVGTALSGSTYGRVVPSLIAAYETQNLEAIVTAGGVRTTAYSHEYYQLGIYHMWEPGKFLWGKFRAGFGGGALGAIRDYRSSPSVTDRRYDLTFGPAICLNWAVAGPIIFSMEGFFGMIQPWMALVLSFQDVVNAGIGVRF